MKVIFVTIIVLVADFLGVCHPYHQCWGSETGWLPGTQHGLCGRGGEQPQAQSRAAVPEVPKGASERVDEYDLDTRSHL